MPAAWSRTTLPLGGLLALLFLGVPAGAGSPREAPGAPRGTGPALVRPGLLCLAPDGTLLAADPGGHRIFRIDPSSGDREVVHGPGSGWEEAGPPTGLVPGEEGSFYLLEEAARAVFQVFPEERRRRLVTLSGERGAGPPLEAPEGLERLPDGRLVTALVDDGTILAIDPATGDRKVLSGPGRGRGHLIRELGDLAVTRDGRLLATTLLGAELLEIDPATGNRRVLADLRGGPPPYLELTRGLGLGTGDEVLVSCLGTGRVMAVEPRSGRRRLVTSPESGSGALLPQARDAVALPDGTFAATWPDAGAILRIDTAGRRSALSGPPLPGGRLEAVPAGLSVSASGRVVALDLLSTELIEIDPDSGSVSLLSGAGRGLGPPLGIPIASCFRDESSVCVVDRLRGLVEVDLGSGDRRLLPGSEALTGWAPEDPCSLVPAPGGRLLMTDGFTARVFEIDPQAGTARLVTGEGSGGGSEMRSAEGSTLLPGGLLAVADGTRGALLAVDPRSGHRTDLSTNGADSGPDLKDPWGLCLAPGGELLVANSGDRRLLAVADDGRRRLVSAPPSGLWEPTAELTQVAWHPSGRVLACNPGGAGLLVVDFRTGRRQVLRLHRGGSR